MFCRLFGGLVVVFVWFVDGGRGAGDAGGVGVVCLFYGTGCFFLCVLLLVCVCFSVFLCLLSI